MMMMMMLIICNFVICKINIWQIISGIHPNAQLIREPIIPRFTAQRNLQTVECNKSKLKPFSLKLDISQHNLFMLFYGRAAGPPSLTLLTPPSGCKFVCSGDQPPEATKTFFLLPILCWPAQIYLGILLSDFKKRPQFGMSRYYILELVPLQVGWCVSTQSQCQCAKFN